MKKTKTNIITTTILLSFVISLSLNTVYADEVQFPVLPTANMIGMDIQTHYASEYRYKIVITVEYQVNNPIEVPNEISWVDMTGERFTIHMAEEFDLANRQHGSTPESLKEQAEEQKAEKIIADKKKEIRDDVDEIWGEYRQCLVEFNLEQPVRFQAWVRTATLTEFIIPDDLSNIANRNNEQLKADKAHQVCKTLKAYPWIGPATANKVIDGLSYNFGLDDYNSPDTPEPFTAEDFRIEEQKSMDLQCSDAGKSRGLCVQDMTGVNRGTPGPAKTPFWYNDYLAMRSVPTDLQEAMIKSLQTQCDVYYKQYSVTSFELPTWLEHCVEAKN